MQRNVSAVSSVPRAALAASLVPDALMVGAGEATCQWSVHTLPWQFASEGSTVVEPVGRAGPSCDAQPGRQLSTRQLAPQP